MPGRLPHLQRPQGRRRQDRARSGRKHAADHGRARCQPRRRTGREPSSPGQRDPSDDLLVPWRTLNRTCANNPILSRIARHLSRSNWALEANNPYFVLHLAASRCAETIARGRTGLVQAADFALALCSGAIKRASRMNARNASPGRPYAARLRSLRLIRHSAI